ncbi:hypothetical protein CLAIMM_08898 isoform 2 [Cladophialophora immunda]|nr:hypothetical protein CLAIMM_08898 isoform 2 [Cladophialophora immunda]
MGWTMDDGRWTMDDGRWTMDSGRWREQEKKELGSIRLFYAWSASSAAQTRGEGEGTSDRQPGSPRDQTSPSVPYMCQPARRSDSDTVKKREGSVVTDAPTRRRDG